MPVASPRQIVRRLVHLPPTPIPQGYVLELPGRGRTYVTDVPGPPGAPTVLLLHAVGCTGMLTWFRTVEALSTRYRVVTFDQRWHGRGISSERFSLQDCADDVAAVIGELELDDVVVA
ncbi:MAG TPA: alpha/beta hydrolase, partial [Nocardioides sp.]|nr:alpha/beta hydrolase [Nocardioides sp.]